MKVITLRIKEELYKKIEEFAKNNNLCISVAIRGLIIRGLRSVGEEKEIGEIQIDNNRKIIVVLREED